MNLEIVLDLEDWSFRTITTFLNETYDLQSYVSNLIKAIVIKC
jgi:hypothetical protein